MTFRTRLPKLDFAIDEATVLSVLTEWVRDTYGLPAREYSLDFIKSAIDNQYHVTATFVDAPQRRPVSFEEIAEQSEQESTFHGSAFPPFTINTPPKNTDSDTDKSGESGSVDNSFPETKI